ncbi:MAG: hypothetical protein H0X62_01965 [Bacteroidetes bacterium]|nr:hypothetical protein [Bacteroidota bacterium]
MPGLSGNKITVKKEGAFQVAITANDCTEHSPIRQITVFEKPLAQFKAIGQARVYDEDSTLVLETNTGNGAFYQWHKDNNPLAGEKFYSINLKTPGKYFVIISNRCGSDVSKKLEVSDCALSINDKAEENGGFIICPNPITGLISIEFITELSGEGPIKINIINSMGQLMQPYGANNSYDITREKIQFNSDYINGIYFIHINPGIIALANQSF